jgi:hypothetical protein
MTQPRLLASALAPLLALWLAGATHAATPRTLVAKVNRPHHFLRMMGRAGPCFFVPFHLYPKDYQRHTFRAVESVSREITVHRLAVVVMALVPARMVLVTLSGGGREGGQRSPRRPSPA